MFDNNCKYSYKLVNHWKSNSNDECFCEYTCEYVLISMFKSYNTKVYMSKTNPFTLSKKRDVP